MKNSVVAGRASVGTLALLAIVAFAILFFFRLGDNGPFDVDEAIFSEASAEMVETGDYITPQYNGEPRYHKPPLIYWLQGASMHYLGADSFSTRFPSAVFALLTVIAFFSFLEGMTKNRRFALTATAILGLNLSFLVIARAATADMVLNFFILTGTMTLLANMFADKRSVISVLLGGLLLGLAVLTKGPVALLVPVVVLGTVVLSRPWHLAPNLLAANPVLVAAMIALVVGPWLYLETLAHGQDFIHEFWFKHNVERFSEGFSNTQSGSHFYYLAVLALGFFPWSLLIPSALLWLVPRFLFRVCSDDAEKALPALGLVWAVAVIGLFSFSGTKLPHYILPAYPGLALMLAGRLELLPQSPLSRINWLWMVPAVLVFAAVFFILKWVPSLLLGTGPEWALPYVRHWAEMYHWHWPVTDVQLQAVLGQSVHVSLAPVAIGAILVVGIVTGLTLMSGGLMQGVATVAGAMWMVLMLVVVGVVPVVYAYTQQGLVEIAHKISDCHMEGDDLYFVGVHQPSVRFISAVPFTSLETLDQVKAAVEGQKDKEVVQRFLVKQERVNEVASALGTDVQTFCRGGFCLLERGNVARGCSDSGSASVDTSVVAATNAMVTSGTASVTAAAAAVDDDMVKKRFQ